MGGNEKGEILGMKTVKANAWYKNILSQDVKL
jgi:hypothetical protein